jgi:uridylate kinase
VALVMPQVCGPRPQARRHLAENRILVLASSTGNHFHDRHHGGPAGRGNGLQRGAEGDQCRRGLRRRSQAQPNAVRYDRLTHAEAIDRQLGVMDLTALHYPRTPYTYHRFFDPRAGGGRIRLRGHGAATIVGG